MTNEGLKLFAGLFKSSSEGIIFFDKKGQVIMTNPRALDMFGYTEAELHNRFVEDLIPIDLKEIHIKHREAFVSDPKPRVMGLGRDLLGVKKDNSKFPLEVSLSHMHHDNNMIIVAFIIDITIRKNNEKKLEEQREKLEEYTTILERKVKSRTSELEHMNLGLQSQIQERKLAEQALKKSLIDLKNAEKEILQSLEKEKELGELKSRFVSMASHEFRTPLTTILSSANLIAKYTESDQQEYREKHVNRIKKSVDNLTSILNDFLSLEKLESGLQNIESEEINIEEIIHEVVEEMSQTLKNGQEIRSDIYELNITSDAHILKNILLNLLSNASKYSKENSSIEVSLTHSNHALSIMVSDQGIGIPEEEQKNLFERFFRAKNVTNIKGTGLGLNIVKKYVDLLDGEISFKSKEGVGTVFIITLPN